MNRYCVNFLIYFVQVYSIGLELALLGNVCKTAGDNTVTDGKTNTRYLMNNAD